MQQEFAGVGKVPMIGRPEAIRRPTSTSEKKLKENISGAE
jgi:hypothetical protein